MLVPISAGLADIRRLACLVAHGQHHDKLVPILTDIDPESRSKISNKLNKIRVEPSMRPIVPLLSTL